jgi:hypothetical protein
MGCAIIGSGDVLDALVFPKHGNRLPERSEEFLVVSDEDGVRMAARRRWVPV